MTHHVWQAVNRGDQPWFMYSGQPGEDIPRDVTHVKVLPHPSVRVIKEFAFVDRYKLVCVVILGAIREIGAGAYGNCFQLKEVHLVCQGLRKIGPEAFFNCESLTNITLPHGLQSIFENAFENCSALRKVSIPSTVDIIGRSAFARCSLLSELELKEGLQQIHSSAFKLCKALTAVALPSTLQVVGDKAFFRCIGLQTVEIPANIDPRVVFLGRCFEGCTALVNIAIPHPYVALRISNNAFEGCTLLCDSNDQPNLSLIVNRFEHLPVHKVCYYATTADQLLEVLTTSSGGGQLTDAHGMTPFHTLAASVVPRVDIFSLLLDKYPETVLEHRDNHGNTMMNYLFDHGSSKSIAVLKMTLERTIMDKLEGWGLDERMQSELYRSLDLIRMDDDPEARRKCVRHFFGLVGHWARREMTSLLELVLWKSTMDHIPKQDDQEESTYREACRLHSGADIVIENVAGYLWGEDEPRAFTALSLFPAWCVTKPDDVTVLDGDDFDSEYENESLTDSEFSFDSTVTENVNDLQEELLQMVRADRQEQQLPPQFESDDEEED